MQEFIELLKDMDPNGEAPESGCNLFGVGYEEGLERLKEKILNDRLKKRGRSVEKFIVAPYGAGKSHFMRQLIEIGRNEGFVASEVQLGTIKNITNSLIVYKAIADKMMAPEQKAAGIEGLLATSVKVQRKFSEDPDRSDEVIELWLEQLKNEVSFENKTFQRVLLKALKAHINGEEKQFENCHRWLSGEVTESKLAKDLEVSRVSQEESNRFGESAFFSLCQFVRSAGFPGTIIGLDEAEQSTNVSTPKLNAILSMLRSEMTAVTNIKDASLLKLYAFTPDVIQKMKDYPALQQRVSNPNPEKDFFSGETYAPLIDLSSPFSNTTDSLKNLQEIGKRLVELFYDNYGDRLKTQKDEVLKNSQSWADQITLGAASISNRREMIKLCCSKLIEIYEIEVENKNHTVTDANKIENLEDEV